MHGAPTSALDSGALTNWECQVDKEARTQPRRSNAARVARYQLVPVLCKGGGRRASPVSSKRSVKLPNRPAATHASELDGSNVAHCHHPTPLFAR